MVRYRSVMPRLPVGNLARTIAWYRDVLGFTAGVTWPDENPTFVILERDEITVQFYETERGTGRTGDATLSFDVDSVLEIHAKLANRVTIDWGPEVYWYGRREFAVKDPDGYLLIFSEATTDPPTCAEDDE